MQRNEVGGRRGSSSTRRLESPKRPRQGRLVEAYLRDIDLLALDDALDRLHGLDPLRAGWSLRFFGGLTIDETAEVLEMSPATVKREWALAKLWLRRELDGTSVHQTR